MKERWVKDFGYTTLPFIACCVFWCKSCVGFSGEIEGGEGGFGRLGGRMGSGDWGVRHVSRCDS